MTADDLIAMHKACVQVIEDMQHLDIGVPTGIIVEDMTAIRNSVIALATVQRDILKGALGG